MPKFEIECRNCPRSLHITYDTADVPGGLPEPSGPDAAKHLVALVMKHLDTIDHYEHDNSGNPKKIPKPAEDKVRKWVHEAKPYPGPF